MNMFGSLFKKAVPKLAPKQLVELEFEGEDGVFEVCACQVDEVHKRKIVISQLTEQRLENAIPGCKVRICTLNGETFLAATAQLLQKNGKVLEITPPGNDFEELKAPASETQMNISLTAEYRAMRMPYTQKGDVVEMRGRAIVMVTNMKIPPQTELHVSLALPTLDKTISSQAKALSSSPVNGSKKHHTEIEFSDLSEEDHKLLFRCACLQHCRKVTREASSKA